LPRPSSLVLQTVCIPHPPLAPLIFLAPTSPLQFFFSFAPPLRALHLTFRPHDPPFRYSFLRPPPHLITYPALLVQPFTRNEFWNFFLPFFLAGSPSSQHPHSSYFIFFPDGTAAHHHFDIISSSVSLYPVFLFLTRNVLPYSFSPSLIPKLFFFLNFSFSYFSRWLETALSVSLPGFSFLPLDLL